jgi:glutaredoxin 3
MIRNHRRHRNLIGHHQPKVPGNAGFTQNPRSFYQRARCAVDSQRKNTNCYDRRPISTWAGRAVVILLIDDDAFFRSAIKAILQKEGFQIVEAADGIDGYEIIKEIGASIGLLLTDINMPRMNGLELAQSVTSLYPKMPVLLMTGNALNLQNSLTSYVVLNKPFRRQDLVQAVQKSIAAAAIEPGKSPSDTPLPNNHESSRLEVECSLPFGNILDAQRQLEDQKRKIEVFSAGCCCCEEIITVIRAATCPSCEIIVLNMREPGVAERARQLGVRVVPAVAINGELVGSCSERGPDLDTLRAAGLGVPLS